MRVMGVREYASLMVANGMPPGTVELPPLRLLTADEARALHCTPRQARRRAIRNDRKR